MWGSSYKEEASYNYGASRYPDASLLKSRGSATMKVFHTQTPADSHETQAWTCNWSTANNKGTTLHREV